MVAALQDPRKEVMSIRNLFPDRIAMRLDEPEQVDMVLGDGARDRGATADLISSDPATGAGVAFVRLESDPDPVRVRAAWVSDDDIRAMAADCACARRSRRSRRGSRHEHPTWRTDDPCPVCGTGLTATDDGDVDHHAGLRAVRLVGDLAGRTWTVRPHDRTHHPRGAAGPAAGHRRDPDLAESSGGCIRPVQLRRTDIDTGQVEQVLVPCGATLAAVCPACAERCQVAAGRAVPGRLAPRGRARRPARPARRLAGLAAGTTRRAQQLRDHAARRGQDTGRAGRADRRTRPRARPAPGSAASPTPAARTPGGTARPAAARTPPTCPAARSSPRTTGKVYTAPDGKTYRPSMFLTLTCDSYGKVADDGIPADPEAYDYQRAARDALHFAALFDRFIQNLRRFLGYDLQYFAAIEPQRRLAPHVHIAIRGTVSRAELRQVIAATYHQVWWPSTDTVRFDGDRLPSGTRPPATTSTRAPGKSCPPGTRPSTPSARTISRCTWRGSGPSSTPRASWPGRRTPAGASGT